jgi:hypothetical protein
MGMRKQIKLKHKGQARPSPKQMMAQELEKMGKQDLPSDLGLLPGTHCNCTVAGWENS